MKILYKQSDLPAAPADKSLFDIGIRQCYLKKLSLARDIGRITKKRHHHQGYEIHILMKGQQIYAVEDKEYVLHGGQLILIPPLTQHRALSSSEETSRLSLSFNIQSGSILDFALLPKAGCLKANCPLQIMQQLSAICGEAEEKLPLFQWTVCGQLIALVVNLLRLIGMKPDEVSSEKREEPRLMLAKQFIHDNIDWAPTVQEVADFCHLSCKQLTRIFLQTEYCTPAAYIRNVRFLKAEKLLMETDLSLQRISEQMHFSSEYYFNTFFKQHAGVPPLEYRKNQHGE